MTINPALVLLLALATSCGGTRPGAPAEPTTKDTVWVSAPLDRRGADSIMQRYGLSADSLLSSPQGTGEFVATDYRLSIPLLQKGYVSDFTGLFSAPERDLLEQLLVQEEGRSSREIAVVTLDSAWLRPDSLDAFTLRLFNTWGIGKKGKDNGILIALVPGHRLVRISNGYGIERKLSDARTKAIIDSVLLPRYREGRYFEGTRAGIRALVNALDEQ